MRKISAFFLIGLLAYICACSSSPNGPDEAVPDCSLGVVRYNWTRCSCPADIDCNNTERGTLIWYNPYIPYLADDIYENIDIGVGSDRKTTLSLQFAPAAFKSFYSTWDPCNIDSMEEIDPRTSWGGVMRALPSEQWNLDSSEYLEIRMRANYGDTPREGQFIIELGKISEDINGDSRLNTEDINTNGVLESFEDIGLDGLASEAEPCYHPVENPDPNGDDYYYFDKYDYSHINGTEGNRFDPGGKSPDTEDLDGWGSLDLQNSYFRFTIDFEKEWLGDGFYVPGSDFNGWRTYRINLKETQNYDIIGNPFWDNINYARMWFTGFDTDVTIEIADNNFDYIASSRTTTPSKIVNYIRDYNYLERTFFWMAPASEMDTIAEILDHRLYVFHRVTPGGAGSQTIPWYTAKIALHPNRDNIEEDPEYTVQTVKQLESDDYYLYDRVNLPKYIEMRSWDKNRLIAGWFRVKSVHAQEHELGFISGDTLVLKLICQDEKDSGPNQESFFNEWKNVYSLGAWVRETSPANFDVQIFKGDMGTEGNESNLYHFDGTPYIEILGLDQTGPTYNSGPDGKVDFMNPAILSLDRGYLIFPSIAPGSQPFNPPDGYTYAKDGTELTEKVPEIYNCKRSTVIQDAAKISKYYLQITIKND